MTGWTGPRIIGHRGAAAHAPENTLASMSLAADQGAGGVEFDVRLSADGVPVVFHDEMLERTSNGHGPVYDAAARALASLDAGGYFDPRFAGEPIPTLEAVLKLCLARDLTPNIEIKPSPGRSLETARQVLEVARHVWPNDRPPPLVSSFVWPCLEVARETAPDWPRGLLVDAWQRHWQAWAKGLGVSTIHPNGETVDWSGEGLAPYLALGLPVLVWTVNDRDLAARLLNAGASAIITDDPAGLIDL